MAPTIAPYGSWRSSITVDALLIDRIIAQEPRIDGQTIAWLEGRPSEHGRSVVVRTMEGGGVEELTPAGSDVHDGVHEYGGGAWAIDDGVVYYSERSDDRLYRIAVGAAAAGPGLAAASTIAASAAVVVAFIAILASLARAPTR